MATWTEVQLEQNSLWPTDSQMWDKAVVAKLPVLAQKAAVGPLHARRIAQPQHVIDALQEMALLDEYERRSPTPGAAIRRAVEVMLKATPALPEPEYDEPTPEQRQAMRHTINTVVSEWDRSRAESTSPAPPPTQKPPDPDQPRRYREAVEELIRLGKPVPERYRDIEDQVRAEMAGQKS